MPVWEIGVHYKSGPQSWWVQAPDAMDALDRFRTTPAAKEIQPLKGITVSLARATRP